jgi:Domain of unknown function (DUF4942)/Uncharacterised methyltransferase family (DUF6094)
MELRIMTIEIITESNESQVERNALSLQRNLKDVVAEYDQKVAAVPQAIADFEAAGNAVKTAACIAGTWGATTIDTGRLWDSHLKESLLKSAWKHVYSGLNIESIASAADKKRFEQAMTSPAPFTLDNIRATFGDFLLNPRLNILRGLAEVFSDLDPAFKSHDKVKIGVKGLPKRVIVSNCSDYGWGRDRLRDIVNALAALQRKPLLTYFEINLLLEEEEGLLVDREVIPKGKYDDKTPVKVIGRGIRLRRFDNGNGHLFFEPDALRDINLALAEYYGDVLPDCSEEKPDQQRPGTAVSKDLQYYPTPVSVVERVLGDVYVREGDRVLEPSCGCGRFLDALRKTGASAMGIEIDPGRAAEARAKGHRVMIGNFLETVPTGDFSHVVMNPPFYGKHYAKHVEHALKFLKSGGTLTAILPVTARYDHGLLKGEWRDLPVGSFSESGTNINTTVLTIRIRDAA